MIYEERGQAALKVALGSAVAMVLCAIVANINRPPRPVGPTLQNSATGNTTAATGYTDTFLSSSGQEYQTSGTANVRDLPSPRNSNVLDTFATGIHVYGRWVQGVDSSSRWLRIERAGSSPGYIWEGNIGEVRQVESPPPPGDQTVSPPMEDNGAPNIQEADRQPAVPSRANSNSAPAARNRRDRTSQPVDTVRCILPSGDELTLTRSDCRQRSGSIL